MSTTLNQIYMNTDRTDGTEYTPHSLRQKETHTFDILSLGNSVGNNCQPVANIKF